MSNFSFKIPIPPSLKKNQPLDNTYNVTSFVAHGLSASAEQSRSRNPRPFWLPQETHQNSLFQHYQPDSSMGRGNFNSHAIVSSTPLVTPNETNKKRNLLSAHPPPPAFWATSPLSLPGYSSSHATESINSWIHGTSSLRSMASENTNADEYGAIMLRACNLYLERTLIPADLKNKVLEAVSAMRGYVGEAIEDLGVEGSIKSHYSKYASSVKSGLSKISDRSQDTMSLLLRSGNSASMYRAQVNVDREHCQSIQCLVKRPEKTAVGNVNLTVDTISRALPNFKRNRSGDHDESDDDELIAPTTVKRKLNGIDDGIVEFDSISEKFIRRNVTLRKGQIEMRKAEAAAKKKRKKSLIGTPVTSSVVQKTASSNKQGGAPIIDAIANAPAVTCTRSGRNIKKPEYYQVSRPQKPTPALQTHAKDIGVNKPQATGNRGKTTIEKKEQSRNRKNPQINVETEGKSPLIVHTRSGRAVKNIQHASISTVASKENVVPKLNRKRPVQTERKTGKKNILKEDTDVKKPASCAPSNDLFGDISFGGDDICIPEVTASTRRRVGRVKGLEHLGEQTPPLHHFTANLNPKLVGGATPSQTPEWLLSQRSQSEVKKLQKRKQALKKVNAVAKTIVAKKNKKLTKEEAAVIGVIRGVRPNIPVGMQVVARPECSESEESEVDDK